MVSFAVMRVCLCLLHQSLLEEDTLTLEMKVVIPIPPAATGGTAAGSLNVTVANAAPVYVGRVFDQQVCDSVSAWQCVCVMLDVL